MPVLYRLQQTTARAAERWFESSGGKSRLLPMEGLRGVAVLAVFFVHGHALAGSYLGAYPRLFQASEFAGRIGNVGVDLFFVLSGFLIYGALLHKRSGYGRFLRRRIIRIYPAFLAVLGCYIVLSIVFARESKMPTGMPPACLYVIENIVLLPGLFPSITPIVTVAWSLSFEFTFYLVVPFLIFVLTAGGSGRVRRVGLLIAIGVAFCAGEAYLHGSQSRMISFVSGMLLQEVTEGGLMKALVSGVGQWVSLVALLCLASYHFVLLPKGAGAGFIGVLSTALMSVAIFFVILHVLTFPGALQRFCTWRPMRYWGNISYSYYLAHGLTLKGVALVLADIDPVRHSLLLYLYIVSGGLIAAWVSAVALYLMVEKPLSLRIQRSRACAAEPQEAALPWSIGRGGPVVEGSSNR